MLMLAIIGEVSPITEHLVLLIIAVASIGALFLIILLAVLWWSARKDRAALASESEPQKATEPSQNPFGDPR
jgi:membrane protein DedA with SNARE-associated domain